MSAPGDASPVNAPAERRRGGIALWCIRHPIGTVVLTIAAVVLGLFALNRLAVDLLPHMVYPQIGVRVIDPAVPASIMEDQVTRRVEEQLAITEDAVGIESTTSEGSSNIELYFSYGKDIDLALRDASTRLDRARRLLPTTIDPPFIFKRDPSQIPVLEFVVSSPLSDLTTLRTWSDDVFAIQFLNLPGVAAVEVGGGLVREIHVLPDQQRLAARGLTVDALVAALTRGNVDHPAGRVRLGAQEYTSRTAGRLDSVAAVAALPIALPGGGTLALGEVAEVVDTHDEERVRVRYNGTPGVRVSVQKQPAANTVEVADAVNTRLAELHAQGAVPPDIRVDRISDQAMYVRQALRNASVAAGAGAVFAMLVVYLFLGNVRGTLIIGSAIPISILVTFSLMALGGLSLNLMTLGGLALGVGMLVDNTIVMLENIERHRIEGEPGPEAASAAAGEVTAPVIAATTTNLAAVVPFLFISGLIGLLFRELIFTISAAIVASLAVAVTLVPSIAARGGPTRPTRMSRIVQANVARLERIYTPGLEHALRRPWFVVGAAALLLAGAGLLFQGLLGRQAFLPTMDDGRVQVRVVTDSGTSLEQMDAIVHRLERLARAQGDVDGLSVVAGGFIFGSSQREQPNRSTIAVQLVPAGARERSIERWVTDFQRAVTAERLAGVRVLSRAAGLRGVRVGRSDEAVSVRVRGPDLPTLAATGDRIVQRLRAVPGLRNVEHSAEERRQEFAIRLDRARASELGVDVTQLGSALQIALAGVVAGEFFERDRAFDIRVRLPDSAVEGPRALENLLLFAANGERPAVQVGDVAHVELVNAPTEIRRENQTRIVEVSAALTGDRALGEVMREVQRAMADVSIPPGYALYYGGAFESLQEGQGQVVMLAALAMFLVFVVMAVQYESVRNPAIIMAGVPFALVGVVLGLLVTGLPLSMPVWLGVIMLIGVVVNNSIVLVEFIGIHRERGANVVDATVQAGRRRLRPILMTTCTTVAGMTPLALGLGEGSEMLQPLAVCMVFGLSFSVLVTLLLIPALYLLVHRRTDSVTSHQSPATA
jgi:CzcA family heavy metal efflux pump